MIIVPEEIKQLINTDSVAKNFRVHFVNGEREDLTNKDIVSESVSFNESICSGDTFHFGSAEQSTIIFETVGIENLNGRQIECYLEYSTETLADPSIGEEKQDIGGRWYAIPLGTFVVESSQRNHDNLVHRKVTAYSDYSTDVRLGYQDDMIFNGAYGSGQGLKAKSFQMNVWDFILRNTQCEMLGYSEILNPTTEETYRSVLPARFYCSNDPTGANAETVEAYLNIKSYRIDCTDGKKRFIDKTQVPTISDSTLRSRIFNTLTYDYYWIGQAGVDRNRRTKDEMAAAIMNNALNEIFWQFRNEKTVRLYTAPGVAYGELQADFETKNIDIFVGDERTTIEYAPHEIRCYERDSTQNLLLDFDMKIEKTGKGTGSGYYTYFDALPEVSEMIAGYFEILGQYLKPSRYGGSESKKLNRDDPYDVDASQFSQAWFDEISVSDIGTVKYKFDGAEADEYGIYSVGSGKSVYDMTNNAILSKISKKETIEGLLDAGFKNSVSDVNFIPAEIIMRSMPYIETGDALRVTMPDGEQFVTYVMNRSINGINYPEDTISSEQGIPTGDDGELYG